MTGNQAVGGLTEEELAQIRRLKSLLQLEEPEERFTNRGAVMWAVENEIMRLEE